MPLSDDTVLYSINVEDIRRVVDEEGYEPLTDEKSSELRTEWLIIFHGMTRLSWLCMIVYLMPSKARQIGIDAGWRHEL